MQEELVSVIVPVYNVENYLERCVESILTQSYRNIEILLIDDGSKDSSGSICDELTCKDYRIRVFHKENGGLGSARNYGIDRAEGVYICFVDSDDEIDCGYVESLYTALKKNDADLSICGYFYGTNKYITTYTPKNSTMAIDEALIEFAKGNAFFNFAWNKLYKKEIVEQMSIRFSDRHCAEDMYFNVFYYRNCNKIVTVDKAVYTYYVNLESLSNGRRPKFWEDMLLIYDAMVETCKTKQLSVKYANTLLLVMFRNSVSNYCNKRAYYKECKRYIENCIRAKDITHLPIKYDILSCVDKKIYGALVKRNYFIIYVYNKLIKQIKFRYFNLFCKIRQTVSGR